MKTVIKVENLSKRYRLQSATRRDTLRDAITSAVQSSFRGKSGDDNGFFWALRDVSFAVQEGETLGIIGHNGAGKSTLLKILSRITKPTSGAAELRGRVGSLLEVGTGFHHELTGRENIFLSGAILGMKRREIAQKFDEIIAFAEIEKFIDAPVKHYSSGMFMRLAFSVAAHLEPEILIVDEVLAVGDVNFQFKCLDKMQEIMRRGHTILFVSHNMAAITRLCSRAIALEKGRIVSAGETHKVVDEYLNSNWGLAAEKVWENDRETPQNEVARLRRARVIDESGETKTSFDIRRKIGVEITYEVLEAGHHLATAVHFYSLDRTYIFGVHDTSTEWRGRSREIGTYTCTAWIPGNFLSEGTFVLQIAVSSHIPQTRVHVDAPEILAFDVFDPMTGDTARGDYKGHLAGFIRPIFDWTINFQK